jgi:hypothetical protein
LEPQPCTALAPIASLLARCSGAKVRFSYSKNILVQISYPVKKKITFFVLFFENKNMADHGKFIEILEGLLKDNSLSQKELAEKIRLRRPSISE